MSHNGWSDQWSFVFEYCELCNLLCSVLIWFILLWSWSSPRFITRSRTWSDISRGTRLLEVDGILSVRSISFVFGYYRTSLTNHAMRLRRHSVWQYSLSQMHNSHRKQKRLRQSLEVWIWKFVLPKHLPLLWWTYYSLSVDWSIARFTKYWYGFSLVIFSFLWLCSMKQLCYRRN